VQSRRGGMAVCVDEPRKNRFAGKIDLLDAGPGQIQNVRIAPHGQKSSVGDRHGLRAGLQIVHGEEIPVVQDQLGFFDVQRWKGRQRRQGAKKLASGRRTEIRHETSWSEGMVAAGWYVL